MRTKNCQSRRLDCEWCCRTHWTWYAKTRCRWPRHCWISGDGPWASVSDCYHAGQGPTIMLCDTEAEALEAKGVIDRLACGGRCTRRHRVVCVDDREGV